MCARAAVWLPDSDTLARLALLAVALYLLAAVAVAVLPYAVLGAVMVGPLLGAVLGVRWLAGLLGTPGAILALAAAGLALGLVAYARGRRR